MDSGRTALGQLRALGRLWALGAGLALGSCHKAPPPPPPAVPVGIATARRTDVPLLLHATGTVEPIQSVSVQAQVSGLLMHVKFQEGDVVTQGQVLFEIDPRPFQAALDQAEAAATRDVASWTSAEHDVTRYQALASKEYVTQQQLDQARATANALAGTLRGDTAAIETARLNVQYATIHAPITGRAGSVLVKEGNQVRGGAGQTLVVINQISPILVRFPIPAPYFNNVRNKANESLVVHVTPIGDSGKVENGSLVFLDNAVDSSTSTVLLKANFANSDGALWPGALESVDLQLDVEHNALVVPSSAVQTGQSGSVVWIVDSARKAHVVKVNVLRATDSLTVLAGGGVTEGERVVTDGQLRLTDGARVAIRSADAGVARSDSAGSASIDSSRGRGRRKSAQ